jgi:tetratricopeptide (TPR) repeat protein
MLALFAALAAEPCTPEEPRARGGPVDREAATLYGAVGDEARNRGDLETARVAYREALRHDPKSPASAAALREVCRVPVGAEPPARGPSAAPVSDAFSEGVTLLERGDRAAASAAFERARAASEDPAAALLEGVCQFELGHESRAGELFEFARRDRSLQPTVSFFLGMLALRAGEAERATTLLAEAATDPSLAANASTLSVVARQGGRVVVSALSEVGYDSNVELVPDGTVMPGAGADGGALLAAGVTGRLFGAAGPYLRVGGLYRKQFVISTFDVGQAGGALGARLAGRTADVTAEYGYDFVALGGAPYLTAHRLLALGHASFGDTTVAASYAARLESFETNATAPYSGLRQAAEARVSRLLEPRARVGVGYRAERNDTRHDSALSYVEHGPLALAELVPTPETRIFFEGRFSWRPYDAVDPDLALRRQDRYLEGYFVAEIDLGRAWTARLTAMGRRAFSNVVDFRYTRLATSLGLVYTFGVL